MTAHLKHHTSHTLGEGPNLFPDGSLWWVDLPEGEVWSEEASHAVQKSTFPGHVGKVLPWIHGMLMMTSEGIIGIDSSGTITGQLDVTGGDPKLRCSDACVLPGGGIALGVMGREMEPGLGRLVAVTPDGSPSVLVDNATIPNGLGVGPDGTWMVWVDSPTHTLMRFDIDQNTSLPTNPTPWCELDPALGPPDGLCVDAEGGVWVAMWGGGRVIHLDASGKHNHTIDVPVAHVTAVCFDRDDNLVITSGTAVLSETEKASTPGAGGVWWVDYATHHTRGLPPRISTVSLPPADQKLRISHNPSTITTTASTVNHGGVPSPTDGKVR
jgi:sugar lactone lactonase YvrE